MSEDNQKLKPFLRVLNTDLIGEKPISQALLKVKGVGFSLASVICNCLNISKNKKAGLLSDAEAKKIEDFVKGGKDLPSWLLNRRKDFVEGGDKHLTGSDLKFAKEMDIKRLKKTKSNRGMRLAVGLPTHGQRTRAHFRKSGKAVGVHKSKGAKAAASGKK